MKCPLSYLFCLLISASALAQNPTANEPLANIDSVLTQILNDSHIAGFAVAVVKGNDVIYSKGFGYRDMELKKPVTPNTLFAVGSTSKAFTSSLLGLLREEGKLTFEDKAVHLLPQLQFYSNEMNNQINLRDLMAHRTGLSRYDSSWLFFNTSDRNNIIKRVQYMKPTSDVREKWYYNNFMFVAQGMIVERLSGKTWEQNISEKFFEPLEMTRSTTNFETFKRDSDVALPYTVSDKKEIKRLEYYNINGMGPAGSINSSVNDMANWLKVWTNEGKFKDKQILPASYITEAISSQMVMEGALPDEKHKDIYFANYGLGWMIGSYRGYYVVEHGGNINGFSAIVSLYPSEDLAIVVLTNQQASQVPRAVSNSIGDRLLGLTPINWNQEINTEEDKSNQDKEDKKKLPILNTKPSYGLKEYVGSFEHPAYGVIKITQENSKLYTALGDDKYVLKHLHYDVFDLKKLNINGIETTEATNLLLNFSSDIEGKINAVGILLDGNEKPVMFEIK